MPDLQFIAWCKSVSFNGPLKYSYVIEENSVVALADLQHFSNDCTIFWFRGNDPLSL